MEQTPLFQLNLMIWLAWPGPPGGMVRPIFLEDGFTIWGIAPTFELPLDVRAKAGENAVPFKNSAGPDLLLEHRGNRRLLLIECKVSSFGPVVPPENTKHQSRQASALLSATGSYLADYQGFPRPEKWRAHLLYAVSGGQEAAMQATLEELAEQLLAANIGTSPYDTLGIKLQSDGIYLVPQANSSIPVSALQTPSSDGVQVMALADDQDPRVLYLIPWDPSIDQPDEYERHALEERVRSAFVSLVGGRLDAPTFEVTLDEVLQASVEVWDMWRDRQATAGFCSAVRAYVREILSQLREMDVTIEVRQNTFAFVQIPLSLLNRCDTT